VNVKRQEHLFNKMGTKFIATARVGMNPNIEKHVMIELKTIFNH